MWVAGKGTAGGSCLIWLPGLGEHRAGETACWAEPHHLAKEGSWCNHTLGKANSGLCGQPTVSHGYPTADGEAGAPRDPLCTALADGFSFVHCQPPIVGTPGCFL